MLELVNRPALEPYRTGVPHRWGRYVNRAY